MGSLRLVSAGGLNSTKFSISEGRLEIYQGNSTWNSVCIKRFNAMAANVACQELNFDTSQNVRNSSELEYIEILMLTVII